MTQYPLLPRFIETDANGQTTALCAYNDETPFLFHRWFNILEVIENMTEWSFFPSPHSRCSPEEYCKKTKDTTWLICERGGAEEWIPVGYCGIFVKERHRVGLLRVAIPQVENRGKGHGRRAIRMFLRWAFDYLDLYSVQLAVTSSNSGAIRMYKATGFSECGRYTKARHMPTGRDDEIHMELLRVNWRSNMGR